MAPAMGDVSPQSNLHVRFGILLEDTLRRTNRLESALQELKRSFSTRPEDRSYRFFVEALQLANEGARTRIREIREEFEYEDDARAGNYDDLTSLASGLDDFIERYVPLLHRPRSDELEVFAMPFSRLAKQVIPNVELLFLTWSIDGYMTLAYDVDTLKAFDATMARNLRLTFDVDIKFVQLMHPMLREFDPFHFAVFAHEIGHIALSLSPGAWQRQHEGEGDATPTSSTSLAPDPSSLSFLDLSTRELSMPANLEPMQQKRLSNWFLESACDVFAMRLVGPIFALAYAEVTSRNRPLEPDTKKGPAYHPPPRLRFKVLAEELRRFDLGDLGVSLRPKLESFVEGHLRDQDDDPFTSEEEQWHSAALEGLRERLDGPEGALREQGYKPGVLLEDLPAIFRQAERKIPPTERLHAFEDGSLLAQYKREKGKTSVLPWSMPFDWRSILNGTFLWHLDRCGPPPPDLGRDPAAAEERATHRALAGRLALGGVELSEFQRRAGRRRDEMQGMQPIELETGKP